MLSQRPLCSHCSFFLTLPTPHPHNIADLPVSRETVVLYRSCSCSTRFIKKHHQVDKRLYRTTISTACAPCEVDTALYPSLPLAVPHPQPLPKLLHSAHQPDPLPPMNGSASSAFAASSKLGDCLARLPLNQTNQWDEIESTAQSLANDLRVRDSASIRCRSMSAWH